MLMRFCEACKPEARREQLRTDHPHTRALTCLKEASNDRVLHGIVPAGCIRRLYTLGAGARRTASVHL